MSSLTHHPSLHHHHHTYSSLPAPFSRRSSPLTSKNPNHQTIYTSPSQKRNRSRFHCSIANNSPITPPISTESKSQPLLDCVIVGAGISGLCIAQALATKHGGVCSDVVVTEARDRVGGNISTVERDGYLWEEGPNSFQPSDPMLTMVVCYDFITFRFSILRCCYICYDFSLLSC